MEKNLIYRIEQNKKQFSKGQRLIADYILNNFHKSTFQTAQKLAVELGLSESTVVRFATLLGYDGYKELKDDIHELAKISLSNIDRIKLRQIKTMDELVESCLTTDAHDVKRLKTDLDKEKLYEGIDILNKSRKIFVLGLRTSSFLANYFYFYLKLMGKDAIIINSDDDIVYENMLHMNEEDTFFCISYPRYSKKSVSILKYAKSKGSKVISLTDNTNTTIAKNSDLVLVAKNDIILFIDSFVAPLSLINIIIAGLSFKNLESTQDYLTEMERIYKSYDIYDFDPYEDK